MKTLILFFIFAQTALCGDTLPERFWTILGQIESSNNPLAVGDKGKALGVFQIWERYFRDANLKNFKYTDVRRPDVARQIVLAYFMRYERKALETNDFQTLTRLHNGGPNWRNSPKTINYFNKFKKAWNSCK